MFMDSGGHMDGYYDTIYSIVDGKFVEQCGGEYGAEDNTNVQYDANGDPIYKYYWDGTQVSSKAEYQKLLNKVFNEQRSTDPFDGATYDSNLRREWTLQFRRNSRRNCQVLSKVSGNPKEKYNLPYPWKKKGG